MTGQKAVVGARVEHPTHGHGVVLVATEGFPKLKVEFDSGVQLKVERQDLRVLGVPAPPEQEVVRRVRALVSARGAPGQGERHGMGYEEAEVELIYRVKKSDGNRRTLAKLLARTEDAIDYGRSPPAPLRGRGQRHPRAQPRADA